MLNDLREQISKRLKESRLAVPLTQRQVAEKLKLITTFSFFS
jgi:cytoskeletal protein RodZ